MRKSVRNVGVAAAVGVLTLGAALTIAAEKQKPAKAQCTKDTTAQMESVEHTAYLGVGVKSLPEALVSHLPKTFRNGQGVLVAEVASGSPADKAGLQPQDIVMRYDDQKLFSPEQFVKLVHADRAGHQVALQLVRQAKPMRIQVALGERKAPETETFGWQFPAFWHWNWQMPRWQRPETHATTTPPSEHVRWQSFDSMTIKNLGDHQFQAEIRYLDKDGKLQTQQFKGTRAEIDKAIAAHKDLPTVERQHLLRGLDMPAGDPVLPHLLSWDFPVPDQVF